MSALVEAAPDTSATPAGHRRVRREIETEKSRLRSMHRRRRVITRGGIIVGFVLAMGVYPVMGTLAPYADASEVVPGVVEGQTPTTALALLGSGPEFEVSDLPAPVSVAGAVEAANDVVVTEDDLTPVTVLKDCTGDAPLVGSNGRVSSSSMCDLWQDGQRLQSEAAVALTGMNDVFKNIFGHDMCLSGTYRDLQGQYATRASRGYMAAAPGTSMHGWGLAIDFCTGILNGPEGEWIRANAGTFGWINPYWAKTSKFEPWHWEYEKLVRNYYDPTG